MTTTITPDVPLRLTTDTANHILSLQLLRLYASLDTQSYFLYRVQIARQPIPTFASFVRGLTRLQN